MLLENGSIFSCCSRFPAKKYKKWIIVAESQLVSRDKRDFASLRRSGTVDKRRETVLDVLNQDLSILGKNPGMLDGNLRWRSAYQVNLNVIIFP